VELGLAAEDGGIAAVDLLPASESSSTQRKESPTGIRETIRVLEEYVAEVRIFIRGKELLISFLYLLTLTLYVQLDGDQSAPRKRVRTNRNSIFPRRPQPGEGVSQPGTSAAGPRKRIRTNRTQNVLEDSDDEVSCWQYTCNRKENH